MPMPTIPKKLATTALSLAAAACVPCYTGYGCSPLRLNKQSSLDTADANVMPAKTQMGIIKKWHSVKSGAQNRDSFAAGEKKTCITSRIPVK